MPTPTERTRQLEDDARDLKSSLDTHEIQLLAVDDFRKSAGKIQSDQATEIALLKQKLDENVKRVEAWEGRLWVGAVALITALIAAVLSLVIALIRK